jgi:hypothetical protein
VPDPQAVDNRPEHPELFISYASVDLARAALLHAPGGGGISSLVRQGPPDPGCDWHKEIGMEDERDTRRAMGPEI